MRYTMPTTPSLLTATSPAPNPVQQIVNYVREQLKAEGIPQRVLAEQIGISENRVNRILNHRSTLYASQIFKMGQVLGMTPGDLYRTAVPDVEASRD